MSTRQTVSVRLRMRQIEETVRALDRMIAADKRDRIILTGPERTARESARVALREAAGRLRRRSDPPRGPSDDTVGPVGVGVSDHAD